MIFLAIQGHGSLPAVLRWKTRVLPGQVAVHHGTTIIYSYSYGQCAIISPNYHNVKCFLTGTGVPGENPHKLNVWLNWISWSVHVFMPAYWFRWQRNTVAIIKWTVNGKGEQISCVKWHTGRYTLTFILFYFHFIAMKPLIWTHTHCMNLDHLIIKWVGSKLLKHSFIDKVHHASFYLCWVNKLEYMVW